MRKPLVDRIPFAKILIVLSIVFGISLGLCGLSIAQVLRSQTASPGIGQLMNRVIGLDVLAMVLSAAGLVATTILWVVMTAVSSIRRKRQQPPKLFDGKDDEGKSG
jgi:hypothetical protein